MKKVRLIAACLLVVFSSCNQEETLLQQGSGNDDAKITKNGTLTEKTTSSGKLTTYEIKPEIMVNFKYYYQLNAPSPVDGSKACGPTSYMMATYCLAKYKYGNNCTYTCDGEQLKTIVGKTGVSTDILDLYTYAKKTDNSFLVADKKSTTDRELIKKFITSSLANDRFIITFITGYVYKPSTATKECFWSNDGSVNADMKMTGNIKTGAMPNYITGLNENGTTIGGHIIILTKFVQTHLDGSGYIEYIDPVASSHSPSNRRYVSFTRLLDSMMWNGSGDNMYDALSLGIY
jgi:hypothetical protein